MGFPRFRAKKTSPETIELPAETLPLVGEALQPSIEIETPQSQPKTPQSQAETAVSTWLSKWHKFFYRLLILALVLILGCLTIANIVFAMPGDVAYFPKRYLEDQRLQAAQAPDARWSIYSEMLYDRLRGLEKLSEQKSCVQHAVVEADFLDRLNAANKEFGYQSLTPRQEFIQFLANIPAYITPGCISTLWAEEWELISELSTQYYNIAKFNADPLFIQRAALLREQGRLLAIEKETGFTDQAVLNNVTQLLLEVQRTIGSVKGTQISALDFYEAKLALQNSSNLLAGETEFINSERLVAATCRLLPADNAHCAPLVLQGKFNSINSQLSYSRRLDGGRKLFEDLLQELLQIQEVEPDKGAQSTGAEAGQE